MREIKFRAWVESENKMMSVVGISWMLNIQEGDVEVGSVLCAQENNGAWSAGGDHEVDDVTLMQYSGLKDKNGTDIYEGDILFHRLQGKCVVYYPFNESIASFGIKGIVNGFKNTLQNTDRLYEVIGNIYENKDLLENNHD